MTKMLRSHRGRNAEKRPDDFVTTCARCDPEPCVNLITKGRDIFNKSPLIFFSRITTSIINQPKRLIL